MAIILPSPWWLAGKKPGPIGPPSLGQWVRRTPGASTTNTFNSVAISGGTMLAIENNGNIQRSLNNGVTWARLNINLAYVLRDMLFNGTYWVVVGAGGRLSYSDNPSSGWSTIRLPYTGAAISSIVFTGQYYVAFYDDGRIYRATSFFSSGNWTQVTSGVGAVQIQSAWANGGTIVCVETGGNVRYSTDHGANWNLVSSLGTVIKLGVCFGNETWVVTGGLGAIRTTQDLTTWSNRSPPAGIDYTYLPNVTFVNGLFVGISTEALGSYYSYDAVNWFSHPHTETSNDLFQPNGIAASDTTLVAVGANGRISTCSLEYP